MRLLPDGSLDVRVTAPALDGRANAAILAAVAGAADLRPYEVRLLRGERSRGKLLGVDVADPDELRHRLGRSERKAER